MVGLPGIELTQEQLEIVDCCPKKSNARGQRGRLIRVTAAAGAGKTTTLLALALKAAELGHTKITYVTFTRAAAKDGKERLEKAMRKGPQTAQRAEIEARTLHAFAMRAPMDQAIEVLSDDEEEEEEDDVHQPVAGSQKFSVRSEGWIKKWVAEQCEGAAESFLQPCYRELESRAKPGTKALESLAAKKNAAKEKVMFFIFKSFQHLCRSDWTLKQYKNKKDKDGKDLWQRDYFPIKKFYQDKEKGGALGFQNYNTDARLAFYAEQVCKLWKAAKKQGILTFDIAMKHAQLYQQEVPGSILLVDESQDMDACQTDWIARQQVQKYNKVVFMVGDCCQAIYGFRGAKTENLMKLECHQDKTLTESWRFGKSISNLANLVLYAKEKSPQTKIDCRTGSYTKWIPYRTRPGFLNKESIVTAVPLLPQWKTHKVTVIACKNATLLLEALGSMGFSFPTEPGEDGSEDGMGESNAEEDEGAVDTVPAIEFEDIDPSQLPLIHINGRGESSGMGLWKKTLKIIGAIFDLFSNPNEPTSLDPKLFDDFAGTQVDWKSFTERVVDEELSKYATPISVVTTFKGNTMKAIELFQAHVMQQNIPADKADIILTTCHSAKGMEWDNVHICDDFSKDLKLCSFKKFDQNPSRFGMSKRQKLSGQFEFDLKEWGDDVNMAYVSCTRAKKMVYIPSAYRDVLEALDQLHEWIESLPSLPSSSVQELSLRGCEKLLSKDDAIQLHKDLVLPLRDEWELEEDKCLSTAFIEHAKSEEDDIEDEEEMKPVVVTPDSPNLKSADV